MVSMSAPNIHCVMNPPYVPRCMQRNDGGDDGLCYCMCCVDVDIDVDVVARAECKPHSKVQHFSGRVAPFSGHCIAQLALPSR